MQPKVVVKENKCGYIYENPSRTLVCVVKVDGCLITVGQRCDYLILDCTSKKVFFIELKGKVLTAIDQIHASINNILPRITTANSVNARVVLTKQDVPNLENNPKLIKLRKLLRKLNGDFRKKNITLSE